MPHCPCIDKFRGIIFECQNTDIECNTCEIYAEVMGYDLCVECNKYHDPLEDCE
jgi:hypothetical protein